MAMRWLATAKSRDIWEEPVVWPIGDIEAAHRIRDICRAASGIAVNVGGAHGGRPEHGIRRYERASRAAMEIALKISDDLLRDSAVRQIIDLCFKADDLKMARVLFRAIQAVSIREEVMRDHPQLGL